MRTIKFRAWSKNDNKMIYWNDIGHQETNDKMSVHTLISGEYANLISMQYTGIHDRNGVEIYEGDIVKREWVEFKPGSDDFIGIVKFVEGSFCIEDIEDPYSGDSLFIEIGTNEVIGNIYQPKEE